MKALLLAAATMAAVSCASEPTAAVRVPAHKLSGEGSSGHAYRPGPPTASDERPPSPGSAVPPPPGQPSDLKNPAPSDGPEQRGLLPEPETTTTAAPEPTTTEAPYVAPVTTRATTTTVYDEPHPQAHTTRGACGGTLPPCWVMRRESGGDPRAVNATGCGGRGCYGKWQFDPRTSAGLGYPLTMDQYPEAIQDDAAETLWAGGRGCSHWGAC